MTKITKEEVEHLAHLTRLDLTPEQTETLTKDMESILGLVSQLEEVDVTGIETDGYVHVGHTSQTLTGVQGCEHPEKLLENIKHPLVDNGIVVKSAIKE